MLSKSGHLNLSNTDIWVRSFLLLGVMEWGKGELSCVVRYRMFSSTSGFHPLEARSNTPHPCCTKKHQTLPAIPWRGQNHPSLDHCS